MITVVNQNHHKPTNDLDIYVGRGSPLGNPMRINHRNTREDALLYYRGWLTTKLKEKDEMVCGRMNSIFRAAKRAKDANMNVNLVCYCAPSPCHADFIKQLIEEKL